MPKLKIAIASLLLLIFVLLAARFSLFTVLMDLQKNTSRIEAFSHLQVKTLRLKPADLKHNLANMEWKEHGKELRLNGKMYEVIAKITVHGEVIVYLMADDKESARYDAFAGLDAQQQKNRKDLFQLLNMIGLYLGLGYLLLRVIREGLEVFFFSSNPRELRGLGWELVKPPADN